MHFPKLKTELFVNCSLLVLCVEMPQLSQVGSKNLFIAFQFRIRVCFDHLQKQLLVLFTVF